MSGAVFDPKKNSKFARTGTGGGSGLGAGPKKLVIKSKGKAPATNNTSNASGASSSLLQSVQLLTHALRCVLFPAESSSASSGPPQSPQALYSICEGLVSLSLSSNNHKNGTKNGVIPHGTNGSSKDASEPSPAEVLYGRIRIELEKKVGVISKTLLASFPSSVRTDAASAAEQQGLGKGSGSSGGMDRMAHAVREEDWLKKVEAEWKGFLDQVLMIRSILLPLDRSPFVLSLSSSRSGPKSPGSTSDFQVLPIWDLALMLLRDSLDGADQVGEALTRCLIGALRRDRDGLSTPIPLISSLVSLLSTLSHSTLSKLFLSPFLVSTRRYYEQEAIARLGFTSEDTSKDSNVAEGGTKDDGMDLEELSWIAVGQEGESILNNSAVTVLESSDYLSHVQKRLMEESERCDKLGVGESISPNGSSDATERNQLQGRNINKALLLAWTLSALFGSYTQALTFPSVSTGGYGSPSCSRHVIPPRGEFVVEKGLSSMLSELNTKTTDVGIMYKLLKRVRNERILYGIGIGGGAGREGDTGLGKMREKYLDWVKTTSLSHVLPPSPDENMVSSLLGLKERLDSLVRNWLDFPADESFERLTKDGMTWAINKRENKPAEMIAKFVDQKMRLGNKELGDEELDAALDRVLVLFRMVQGKDVFEAHFQRDLARRLLLNKSASTDSEKRMLLKLRDECGPGWTSKLEIMFRDIEVSQDFLKVYRTTRASIADPAAPGSQIDLSVNVLSMGHWPSYPTFECQIPSSMASALERFRQFYVNKHSGRKLYWQHSLDFCVVKARFRRGMKELNVSLSQTLVLLLFNGDDEKKKLGYKEIQAATRLEPKELVRTLQSLACGKLRVLAKHPKGKDVNETDEFIFNSAFHDDRVRLKINQIQLKETKEENKQTTERVFLDRRPHLEAAIVRILKSRKTLKHTELVMEVVNQIGNRFKVDMGEMKKAIDSLIDREYMERADGKRDVYNYLA